MKDVVMATICTRRTRAKPPRITWVLRSFLDYRVPVFAALDTCVDHQLHVIFPKYGSPESVQKKLSEVLGHRAIALMGGTHIGVAKPRSANTSICISFQPGLYRTIEKTQPDVLIGDGFFQWTTVALLYRIIRKIPLVVCYERTCHTERKAQWYRQLYRRAVIKFVGACCVNGQQSLEYTRLLGMPDTRMTTGFMAADTESLEKQCASLSVAATKALRAQWQTEGLVFLFAGRLIPLKGVSQLLAAWSRFEHHMPGAGTLVLVGSGSEEGALKRQTMELNLKAVRFIGRVDYNRMASCYAAADVFIMPTLEDNWSLVVPEAMACGLPVLTSLYNGCWPELIHVGENGWVFDALDPEAICKCLERCVTCQAGLRHMGQRSRDIVGHFTPRHAAASILKACEIALRHRAPV
jgi:glycosyltransferase involved in cell wall biosynthesis